MQVIKPMSLNKNPYINTPDKGQEVVILDSEDYKSKVLDVINDVNTISKITVSDQQLTI